jgi:hypothetical protein
MLQCGSLVNFEEAGSSMYGKKGRSLLVLKHVYKPALI